MRTRMRAPRRLESLLSDPANAYWVRRGSEYIVDGGREFPWSPGLLDAPKCGEILVSGSAELRADGHLNIVAADRSRVTSTHGTVYAIDDSHTVLLKGADGHILGRGTFEARANSHVYPHHQASGDLYDEATVFLQRGATGQLRVHNRRGVNCIAPHGYRAVYIDGAVTTVHLVEDLGQEDAVEYRECA